ncbi:MAG: radical SAM protein [Spirochaetales bacterium]|nr:radical SAM protein [Spirochaetales bacterium]
MENNSTDYIPTHGVWEITYACNMRCMHCGSACGEKYPDELTTEEALDLCDQLASIGLRKLTLSGGEPFMREDWPLLARRLTDRGVVTNAISNGWFIDERLIDRAFESGLVNIGISIDGLGETHDTIRKKGSFERVLSALTLLRKRNMPVSVNTSINNRNLAELPGLRDLLVSNGVIKWQFQIARPMGNFLKHRDLVLSPDRVGDLIDFAHETVTSKHIDIHLGDDIGYYSRKQDEINRRITGGKKASCWTGCHAGKRVIGIFANGDINGCLSIRDREYIEGNIRQLSLKEIWNRPGAFAWNRELTKNGLEGFCRICAFGSRCLGGCAGSKLTMTGSMKENTYCSYRTEVEKQAEKIAAIDDYDELIRSGYACIKQKSYQVAALYFERALDIKPDDPSAIDNLGFVHFFLENYEISKAWNERALALNPKNAYARKGLGLCLSRLGRVKEGIFHITRAIQLAGNDTSDYYIDLAVVLDEHRRTKEAVKILERVRKHSEDFRKKSETLYRMLAAKIG